MKGVVFTEYLEMVEEIFGLKTTDQMIQSAKTSTGGAFTSVGNYPCEDLLKMVSELSKLTKIAIPSLVQSFGKHFFKSLHALHPNFIDEQTNLFSFLETIDQHIHVEVQKIYPNAQLPKFEYHYASDNQLDLTYQSPRPLGDFAEGLIYGSAEHYATPITITKTDLSKPGLSKMTFHITKQ